MDKTLSPLDALAKLLQFSSITENNAGWINEDITKYLSDKTSLDIESLPEKSQLELIEQIKTKFLDNLAKDTLATKIPDFLTGTIIGTDPNALGNKPVEVDNTNTTEEVVNKSESDRIILSLENKLDVSKLFMQEMDVRLARFESVDVDHLIELNSKYAELGTPEELQEALKALSAKTSTLKSESGDETMKTTDTQTQEDKDALLARYQALGTPEEIEELMETINSSDTDGSGVVYESKTKSESRKTELAHAKEALVAYQEIGSTDEILGVITKYADTQMKYESERISTKLGISVDKVKKTIDKMESVSEAEEFLTEMFKDMKTVAEPIVPVTTKSKNESGSEHAVVVGATTPTKMTQLAQICGKL